MHVEIFVEMNLPENYIPVLIQAAVGLGFVAFSLIASHLLGPKRHSSGAAKDDPFECGIEVEGNARTPYSVKYFLTAILFVLFDIEIVFFYPYAVNFKELGLEGFLAVVTFIAIFFIGFFYVLKRGALDWNK